MRAAMTNNPAVHPLTALDLVISAPAASKRRRRRPSLTSTLKAAQRAGADHVELVDDKVVIHPGGEPASRNWRGFPRAKRMG